MLSTLLAVLRTSGLAFIPAEEWDRGNNVPCPDTARHSCVIAGPSHGDRPRLALAPPSRSSSRIGTLLVASGVLDWGLGLWQAAYGFSTMETPSTGLSVAHGVEP